MPYIERMADDWAELYGSQELAAEWADRLIGTTRLALSPDKSMRGFFHMLATDGTHDQCHHREPWEKAVERRPRLA